MTDNHPPTPLVALSGPYTLARLERREKRFIVHATLLDGPRKGEAVVAHIADPGRLPYLMTPGQTLLLTGPFPPPRKLAWSVKIAVLGPQRWTSLDTTLANRVVPVLVERGALPQLPPAQGMRCEVRRGDSRVDLLWEAGDAPEHRVEVKTVSLIHPGGVAGWPDAPSARGRKHVEHLIQHVRDGGRASIVFVTYRPEALRLVPERAVDPVFADLLVAAHATGVQLIARRTRVTPEGVFDVGPLTIDLGVGED